MKKGILLLLYVFSLIRFVAAQDKSRDQSKNIDISSPKVTLRVFTSPPKAKIFIDNKYYGLSPLNIMLTGPGDYNVEARLYGMSTNAQVTITREKYTEINLMFFPQPLNIVPFIILLVLTGLGVIVFRRVKTKEVKYSNLKRLP